MAETKVDLSKMNPKEKWDYLWYYYKNYMIYGIIGLILGLSIVFEVVTNDEVIFNLTLCGQAESIPGYNELEENITKLLSPDAKRKETARVQLYALENIEESFDELTALYQQKLMTQVAAGELDLLVINEVDFDPMYQEGLFEPLGLNQQINWDQIDSQSLVYGPNQEEVYAIKVEGNPILEALDYPTQHKLLVMINNSTRQTEAAQVINYLLSAQSIR